MSWAVGKGTLDPLDRASVGQVLALLGYDRPGVRLREDGLSDSQWVEFLADPFLMGGAEENEESRQRKVTFPAFAISRYLVTNLHFEAFGEDGGYPESHLD